MIAVGKDEVTFIGELPKEDVILEEESPAQNGFMAKASTSSRFSELLSSFKKRK